MLSILKQIYVVCHAPHMCASRRYTFHAITQHNLSLSIKEARYRVDMMGTLTRQIHNPVISHRQADFKSMMKSFITERNIKTTIPKVGRSFTYHRRECNVHAHIGTHMLRRHEERVIDELNKM